MKLNYFPVLILTITCILSLSLSSADTINISDFGAIPNDGKNDIDAHRKAAAHCSTHPGTALIIPEGVYDVVDQLAQKIEYQAITGAYGRTSSDTLFKHTFPYVKVLDFSGSKNITIEDNWILDCAYQWGAAIAIGNSGISELSGQSNSNIMIRNNVIRMSCRDAISVTDAKNITIKNNQISGTTNAIYLRNTSDVTMKSNGILPVLKE